LSEREREREREREGERKKARTRKRERERERRRRIGNAFSKVYPLLKSQRQMKVALTFEEKVCHMTHSLQ